MATSSAFNDTEPTSTQFQVHDTNNVNGSGDIYIAYLFADCDLFRTFSYTGNGSADGPFVPLPFLSAIYIYKRAAGIDNWETKSSVFSPNPVYTRGFLNTTSDIVADSRGEDLLSNGVKIRTSTYANNSSGEAYYGFAFADTLFGGSNISEGPAR